LHTFSHNYVKLVDWTTYKGDETLTDVQLLELAQQGAKKRIVELREEIATLEALVSGNGFRSLRQTQSPVRHRRRLSADARARIAAAQRARWAKIKRGGPGAGKATSAAAAGPRKRRRMSATQRAAVSRRMKAYWAKRRATHAKK